MSAVTSIAVTRRLAHAARSCDSVSTRSASRGESVYRWLIRRRPFRHSLVPRRDRRPRTAAARCTNSPSRAAGEAVAHPAAPEEHPPDTPRVHTPVAAARAVCLRCQATLISAHHSLADPAARAHDPHAEHGAGTGVARTPRSRQRLASVGCSARPRPRPPRARSRGPAARRSRRRLTFIAAGQCRACRAPSRRPKGEPPEGEGRPGAAPTGMCRRSLAGVAQSPSIRGRAVSTSRVWRRRALIATPIGCWAPGFRAPSEAIGLPAGRSREVHRRVRH